MHVHVHVHSFCINFFVILGTQAFAVIMFVACNAFFGVLDLTGKPEFLLKYKIQEARSVPVSQ